LRRSCLKEKIIRDLKRKSGTDGGSVDLMKSYLNPQNQCFGSGSGRIRIILPDPADPDRYQIQAYEKVDRLYFFPAKFECAVMRTGKNKKKETCGLPR
jgi:hypothetical protein